MIIVIIRVSCNIVLHIFSRRKNIPNSVATWNRRVEFGAAIGKFKTLLTIIICYCFLGKSRRNDRNVVHIINNRDGFKKSRSQPTPQMPWVTETLIKYYCYRKVTVLLSLLNYCAGVIHVLPTPKCVTIF